MEQATQSKSKAIFATLNGIDKEGNSNEDKKTQDNPKKAKKPKTTQIKNQYLCILYNNTERPLHNITNYYNINPKIQPNGWDI